MKLSKTEVLALFLASANAQNVVVSYEELVNSNCSMDTVAASTPGTSLTTCSTMGACTTDADCTNEKCGTWVETGTANADSQSFCVHNDACNNVGKRNGNAWSM